MVSFGGTHHCNYNVYNIITSSEGNLNFDSGNDESLW